MSSCWSPVMSSIDFVYDYFKQYGHTWFWQLWQPKKNTQSLFHGSDQWLQRLNQNVQVKVRLKNKHKKLLSLHLKTPKCFQKNNKNKRHLQPQPATFPVSVFHGVSRCAMQWQVLRAIGRWIGPWVNMRNAIAWFASMIRSDDKVKTTTFRLSNGLVGKKTYSCFKANGLYIYIYIYI